MKKNEIYALAIMTIFNLASRAASEHLEVMKKPLPPEDRFPIVTQQIRDRHKIQQLEYRLKLDSLNDSRPGRYNRLREIHARRDRQEFEQLRARQEEQADK